MVWGRNHGSVIKEYLKIKPEWRPQLLIKIVIKKFKHSILVQWPTSNLIQPILHRSNNSSNKISMRRVSFDLRNL